MVYMYHTFLIHLSADGHLGCFQVLAIINSAVMNIAVHIRFIELKHFLSILYPSDFQNVVTGSINRFWAYTADLLNQTFWRQKLINLYLFNPYKDSVAPKF